MVKLCLTCSPHELHSSYAFPKQGHCCENIQNRWNRSVIDEKTEMHASNINSTCNHRKMTAMEERNRAEKRERGAGITLRYWRVGVGVGGIWGKWSGESRRCLPDCTDKRSGTKLDEACTACFKEIRSRAKKLEFLSLDLKMLATNF